MTTTEATEPKSGVAQSRKRQRPLTAYQFALQTLREEILQGRLKAGERLRQDELAERIGVSTTPIREALRTLVSEGLASFDTHRGAVVRGLTLEDVREIYRLRMVLEPMLVESAILHTPPELLRRAEELHAMMLDTVDVVAWTEFNRQFHAVLFESQEETRLANFVKTLRDAATPYIALSLFMRPEHIAASNLEHAEILDHYRQKDVQRAKQHEVEHLGATLKIIVEAIEKADNGHPPSSE
ncbi:GntR family transcriptional regulator [Cupriavidus pauculus]|uniref:GntR family transcriptional regulator n=1 Tax=Cupriavidus pauculus TaxID=82633 RepID=A0A2N5CDE6_9BURK|nr:GntR family transcriptional regulator [Cupriavidus pauculus]PLQ00260.1 GntR family transcriptional regulator [Cupriavidus pauculus]